MAKEIGANTSKDTCAGALNYAKERLGKTPTQDEYDELGLTPCGDVIIAVCGSWTKALREAGIEPIHCFDASVDDCHAAIKEVDGRISDEDLLSSRKYEKHRDAEHPSITKIRRECGKKFVEVRDELLEK